METFYLILLVPIVIALVARLKYSHTLDWRETGLQIAIVCAIVTGVWYAGLYSKMADTQLLNGMITSKDRDHGHYVTSYSCNCTTDSEGNSHCDTCYEDHYTVTWTARTTVGDIRLDHKDSTWRSVYNTPDPPQYVAAYKGEPCSIESTYDNYIKAVPESLFNLINYANLEQFASQIPAYPRVHSYYKVNRVISMGVPINTAEWNAQLNEFQKVIGSLKQVNVVVVLVNTADQTYRYALEKAWIGGKKNDVIVTIGASQYPKIDWVDTITLGQNAGNSLMTVEMRDNIMALGSLEDSTAVINTIKDTVVSKFDRKPMADYEYLKDEIDPPTWVIIAAFILSIVLSIGLTIYFHHKDTFGEGFRSRYSSFGSRYRRF